MKKAIKTGLFWIGIGSLPVLFFCTAIEFNNPYDSDGTFKGHPVITLIGDDTVSVIVGGTYTEPGYTVIDDKDDLTQIENNVVTTVVNTSSGDTVNSADFTNQIGIYLLYYHVVDSEGKSSDIVRRMVIVRDQGKEPVVRLKGPNPQYVYLYESYIEFGAYAIDKYDNLGHTGDGDLTSQIVVTGTVDTAKLGSYSIIYKVTDSEMNSAQVVRTVIVREKGVGDTIKPVITILGSNPWYMTEGDNYQDSGATAYDNVDGDISSSIITSYSAKIDSTSPPGNYTVTYSVSDSSGNSATASRTVVIRPGDTIPPVIVLLGDNPYVMEFGGTYNEPGAFAVDNMDDTIPFENITVITDSLNTTVSDKYNVFYEVQDQAGNEADTFRIVIVLPNDTDTPLITLYGSDTVNLTIGEPFTDSVTAYDSTEGDVSDNIIKTVLNHYSDTVGIATFTDTGGFYTIYYNVSDTSGNAAATKQRIVIVDDTGMVLLEDFDFGENAQSTVAGWHFGQQTGLWHAYVDTFAGQTIFIPDIVADFKSGVIDSEGYQSTKGLYIIYKLLTPNLPQPYAGIVINMKRDGKYYNFSKMEKITFKAKGSVTLHEWATWAWVRVNIQTKGVFDLDTWGHLGDTITLTPDWQEYTIVPSQLVPEPGSVAELQGLTWDSPNVKDKVTALEIKVASDNDVTVVLYLDDIKIYGVKVSDLGPE